MSHSRVKPLLFQRQFRRGFRLINYLVGFVLELLPAFIDGFPDAPFTQPLFLDLAHHPSNVVWRHLIDGPASVMTERHELLLYWGLNLLGSECFFSSLPCGFYFLPMFAAEVVDWSFSPLTPPFVATRPSYRSGRLRGIVRASRRSGGRGAGGCPLQHATHGVD
jgi:hypothetical protein